MRQSNQELNIELSYLVAIPQEERSVIHQQRINKIEDILGKREFFFKMRKQNAQAFSLQSRFHLSKPL